MRFSVILIFALLNIQNISSTAILNCALGLVDERQCPVDGGWSLWTTWSNCDGQCSSVGRQVRTRNCSNPQPSNNGVACVGNQFEVRGCGVPGCSYEQYEKLLAQDSNRLQQLKALKQASGSQNALLTKCLLSHCSFETISQTLGDSATTFWNSLQCVKKNTGCPVAGGWGEWSEWSRCSALCGQGEQFRCHVCCDPPSTSTHTSCHGESCEFHSCVGTRCGQSQKQEGAWSSWSQWSVCSAPCRLGLTRRSRTCQRGSQKKAKKSLSPQANNEELGGFDYWDYYDSYFDYNYGSEKDRTLYNERGFGSTDNQLSKLKKRAGDQCDTKIEYYSTEDDEDYSITFSKAVIGPSTMQVNSLANNNLKNVQNLPEATQFQLKHLDSTASSEHLLASSTNPTTERSYFHTVQSTTKLLETSKLHLTQPHGYCSEPMSVTSIISSKPSKDFEKPHTKGKGNENYHGACSESEDVTNQKSLKDMRGKPHTKGKGKSPKNHLGSKITTLFPVTTKLHTDRPIDKCSSENNSEEDKYQIQSNSLQETTVFEEDECTNNSYKDKEEEISMFGNIDANGKYGEGKKKSDESNTYGTESTAIERKTAQTTCLTIKPEDDIRNLGKDLNTQTKSLSQTFRSPTDITESFNSMSSSLISVNEIKNGQSSSDYLSITSSPVVNFGKNNVNSSSAEKTTMDEDLDVDNTSNISNQQSCDIRKVLQLPSYNNSFVADNCKGPFEEIKSCNTKPCSEEGGWSSWSAWSPCSKECGIGKQVSDRSCTQPEPVKKGLTCKGETTRKRSCFEQICPVKVATPRAMMMSGESFIKYDMLHQHSSVLLLYFRFQLFNCSGSLIFRKSSHCGNDHKCDLLHISLYNCYILLVARKQKCYTYLLSNIQLCIGEWHAILITIVGAVVTMRLDDSFVTQSANLSCRPLAPNFDSAMKVGGNFIGEIDRLRINFKNYHLQQKNNKRDILSESEENVEPEEISQVQFSLNKEETTTLGLALFLHAPCFANESSWRVEVAIKPEFSEGLLLFFRGYNQGEFVLVTLEHTRVRLQVKVSSEYGECEQPTDIAPHTWIHVAVSKQSLGPVGLALNGGERCVVSFLETENSAEEPNIRCIAGIFLGEVPPSIKQLLVNSSGESNSLNSPLGVLGSLTVDNHTLDLSRLPHKITSDSSSNQSTKYYKFSSDMASVTVHYEEMFILEGEPFSLLCLYDLSRDQTRNVSDNSRRNLDFSEYSASWIKLDLPVEAAFETSGSNVTYQITDSGKSTSLNITHYTDFKGIEGFYSCWLQYPLPLQPGLNIITYSVVVITDHREVSWITIGTISNIVFIFVLLIVCVSWIIIEAILNFKRGSGFYHCKKLGHEEALERVRSVIFSKQGTKLLGNTEAANESYQRCLADMLATEFDKATNQNEPEPFFDEPSDDGISVDDVKIRNPDKNNIKGKGTKRPIITTVGYVTEDQKLNPFFTKDENKITTEKSSYLKLLKGKVFNPSKVSIDDLQRSEDEDALSDNERGVGNKRTILKNYSVNNSAEFKKKEVGLIQETSAYKSIQNELKFKHEKFKDLDKYKNKGNK